MLFMSVFQESSQTVDVTPSQLASDPAVSKYMVIKLQPFYN